MPPAESATDHARPYTIGIGQRLAAWLGKIGWPGCGLLVSALISVPIWVVLASLFHDSDGNWEHLRETRLVEYVKNTLILAAGVTSITTVIGVTCGWLVAMCRFPGHRFFTWALLLPLAIPTYLITYSYSDLLQYSGPIQTWLRDTFSWTRQDYWFPEVRSLPGAIAMLSAVLYPYVYLSARAAFLEQSVCALEVSRTLGLSPWKSFLRVALPLARPSIVAGCSLVLMETVAEFGAVDYCAVDTFATGIYRTLMGLGSQTAAAQLSAVLLMVVGTVFVLERVSRGRAQQYQATHRYRTLPKWELPGWRGMLAALTCFLPVLVGFVVPTLIFVVMTWNSGDQRALGSDLEIELGLIDEKESSGQRAFALVWELSKNTFFLGAITSCLAVSVAVVIAYGKRLYPSLLTRTAALVSSMGYAIPGGVVAIGVLIPAIWLDHQLGDWLDTTFGYSTGLLFSGTVAAVIFGYLVRFMAVSLNVTEAGLSRIRRSLDDASRTLGASRTRSLVSVHLPLMRGSLLAAALLVFVDVTKELPATLILRPFDFDTLAVRVHQLAADERLTEASTGALMIILVGLIPVILLSRAISKSRPGQQQGHL